MRGFTSFTSSSVIRPSAFLSTLDIKLMSISIFSKLQIMDIMFNIMTTYMSKKVWRRESKLWSVICSQNSMSSNLDSHGQRIPRRRASASKSSMANSSLPVIPANAGEIRMRFAVNPRTTMKVDRERGRVLEETNLCTVRIWTGGGSRQWRAPQSAAPLPARSRRRPLHSG